MSIESREDATRLAQQVVERDAKINMITEGLRDKDVLSLECPEALQLESLLEENAAAALVLAQWILREPPPPPSPRIFLVVERPNRHLSIGVVEGARITASMREAAEDLLHTIATDERLLPKDLYDLIARAFCTTRDDAKERILAACYGGKMTQGDLATEKPPA
jgi:hypothetical protein